MKHSLKGLCGAGALVLPLSVMVPAVLSPALAQQSNGFYGQTTTQSQAGGSLQLFNDVEQQKQEIRELRGQIDELRYQLEQLQKQTRAQYMDLDSRLSSGGQQGEASSTTTRDDGEKSGNSNQGSNNQGSSNTSPASGDAKNAYQSAFAKVQSRNFDQAITEFNDFVKKYPDTSLTANAWYWLGELYSAKSSFGDSEKAFSTVLEQFPDSSKVPDAMYKLGLLKSRQGDAEGGKALLQAVSKDYPDSNAASLASDYLRQSG
ncbi:tol-pal system protein YbgF [Halomonas binhaiensis]|uniref:Cell division coordinator CpoB n=1 Tax=Halomonas binhaiensis TaxID=2562282 RepID=A0A5C1NHZ4_9GAMM|nr:tol-pal system protein YbgF [Halomonas binhaiensis]QEM81857.1 tol-pal system protein YbgF [Halomonas binhaiensis]